MYRSFATTTSDEEKEFQCANKYVPSPITFPPSLLLSTQRLDDLWVFLFLYPNVLFLVANSVFFRDSMPTSVGNSAAADEKDVQDEEDHNEYVPPQTTAATIVARNGEGWPSINDQRKEKKKHSPRTSAPLRRGQCKRTRSKVGQEWDLLLALKKRQKVVVEQKSASRQRKGELDSKKKKKASPTQGYENQRSFFVKLLFSDDSDDE